MFRGPEVRLAATGHRPSGLTIYGEGIYKREQELVALEHRLLEMATAYLKRLEPREVYSGMALGWDMAIAEAAQRLGLALVAAIPFKGQEARWTSASKERYHRILTRAQVVTVSEHYSPQAMQKRNEYLVDNADVMLALWTGAKGGTANCIRYARQKRVPVRNTWQNFTSYAGIDYLKE